MRGPYNGKYKKLTEHLELLGSPAASLTFDEVEAIIGFQLPESARLYQAWWANQPKGQSLAWLRAGFRTCRLSMEEKRLTFLRIDQPDLESEEPGPSSADPLTIAEAKQRLARTFAVDPSQIEITIRA